MRKLAVTRLVAQNVSNYVRSSKALAVEVYKGPFLV